MHPDKIRASYPSASRLRLYLIEISRLGAHCIEISTPFVHRALCGERSAARMMSEESNTFERRSNRRIPIKKTRDARGSLRFDSPPENRLRPSLPLERD